MRALWARSNTIIPYITLVTTSLAVERAAARHQPFHREKTRQDSRPGESRREQAREGLGHACARTSALGPCLLFHARKATW